MTVSARLVEDRYGCAWGITAEVREVRHWRREVGAVVAGLGGDRGAVQVAQLGVTELLANVCRHVEDRLCRLEVRRTGELVRVSVADRSRQVPAVLVQGADAESGRGLWLLREITHALGYDCTPEGECVWFTVPLATT